MSPLFTTPEDAEDAFYDAIGRADLDALMGVWADEEEIVCIHPTGQRLVGTRAIRESWRSVLTNNPRLSVRVQRGVVWKGGLLSVHSVFEMLYLGDEPTPHGPMLSTNVFQRGADGWRLIAHHTSSAAEGNAEASEASTHTLH